MIADDVTEPSARAFFGRRKGHPLRTRQSEIIAKVLPRLRLNLGTPIDDLRSLFGHHPEFVRLEIGFGAGEHLIAQAQAHPEVGFIGCEPFVNGMARMLAAAAERQISNIRVYGGDAVELLAWMPRASLSGIDLLYPDPWPKRRHWKRRLVQDYRIGEFARVLQREAAFRFATDWADYAAWTLDVFTRSSEFVWTAERADDWRIARPGHVQTRYEAKAVAVGRKPTYLTFKRL